MGLFGRKRQPGITEYELEKQKLHSRLASVFGFRDSGRRKMAALDTALTLALDPDHNTPADQRVIQKDEFETVLTSLTDGGVISEKEAEELRTIAAEDLRD